MAQLRLEKGILSSMEGPSPSSRSEILGPANIKWGDSGADLKKKRKKKNRGQNFDEEAWVCTSSLFFLYRGLSLKMILYVHLPDVSSQITKWRMTFHLDQYSLF